MMENVEIWLGQLVRYLICDEAAQVIFSDYLERHRVNGASPSLSPDLFMAAKMNVRG